MATKPKSGTALAVQKPQSRAVGASIDAAAILKAAAERGRAEVAKAPSASANSLSFRNGVIRYQDREIGQSMKVIVLAPQFERVYYSQPWSADNVEPPDCYSFDGTAPHADSANPQAKSCAECPMSQWESAQNGKGKACKEGLRAALLPGDKLAPDQLRAAPIVMAKFSVLNSKSVRSYLEMLYETAGHPARVVSVLKCKPDSKMQYAIDFEMGDTIGDDNPEALSAVASRIDEAGKLLTQPYPKPDASAPRKGATKPVTKRIRKF